MSDSGRWKAVRGKLIALLTSALLAPFASQAPGAAGEADLARARAALARNIEFCRPLVGEAVTPAQAAEAAGIAQESLDLARAVVAADPNRAEGHHHVGATLCLGYYPRDSGLCDLEAAVGEQCKGSVTVIARGSLRGEEEGLAAFRTALRLAPNNTDYGLDYCEALQVCGEAQQSADTLSDLWKRRRELTGARRAQAARLLAQAMRDLGRREEEARWLREALARDPGDAETALRLSEVAANAQEGIVWHGYETGEALSRHQQKPVWISFSTACCGWCRKLKKEVFTDPGVVGESRRLICIEVDGDHRRDLVSRYQVREFPTSVFLDPAGRLLHKVVGCRSASQYATEMQHAKSGS